MTNLINHLKTHYRSCQVKPQKNLLNKHFLSHCIPQGDTKSYNKQRAIQLAESYMDFTKNESRVFDTLIALTQNYNKVIPSQTWVAKNCGCSLRTVGTTVRKLNRIGLIHLIPRGWSLVNVKKGIYKSKTNEYKLSKYFMKTLKFINKVLPKNHPSIIELMKKFPAIKSILFAICLLTNLILNNEYLISSNMYIQRDRTCVFGQDNFEIAKIYKSKKILPTITLSVPGYKLEESVDGNTYYEDYPYTKYNNELIRKHFRSPKKRNLIDLRNCTEATHKTLSFEDQKISSDYCTGKRQYGSIEKYEKSLIKRGLWYKIWRCDDKRRNAMNTPLKDTLKEYGFNYKHLEPKRPIKPKQYTYKFVNYTKEDPVAPRGEFPSEDKLTPEARAFLGQDIINQFRKNFEEN